MTFLEALKTGRPMRRRSNSSKWENSWLYLGHDIDIPRWRQIESGRLVGLMAWDYLADDWEVMP